ncbi:ATP-binding protein [Sneathiella sp.]|jgi:hypothetical protein|uniref:ATP-binding protein n=1 Tax=Sneathiella sp. TaxID=1964365 RepID=UPI0039E5BFD3
MMHQPPVPDTPEITQHDELDNDASIRAAATSFTVYLEAICMPDGKEEVEKLQRELPGQNFEDLPAYLQELAVFGNLDTFECQVILLSLLSQVDSHICDMLRDLQGLVVSRNPLTVAVSLSLFEGGTHAHFLSDAPLLRNGIITVKGDVLFDANVDLDPAVLGFLMTGTYYDPVFSGTSVAVENNESLSSDHKKIVKMTVHQLRMGDAIVQLVGSERQSQIEIAASASEQVGWKGLLFFSQYLPATAAEIVDLVKRWRLSAALNRNQLILDATTLDPTDRDFGAQCFFLQQFMMHARCTVILLVSEPLRLEGYAMTVIDIGPPTNAELKEIWARALFNARCQLLTDVASEQNAVIADGDEDQKIAADLSISFSVSISDISATYARFFAFLAIEYPTLTMENIGQILEPEKWRIRWWQAACQANPPDFRGLARALPVNADFSTLVVDRATETILQEVISQFKNRSAVRKNWGLEPAFQRGNGISVLMAGASGTGKTLAAEVLANSLSLNLYQIDLSQLVSKYIGETQKNLSRIFEEAEKGGAVLLFDEADALFAKRTDVKDSRDRHANMEVGFLLQRMEEYRGIAILTTNMKENLDDAFLRRLQYVVDFPFPSEELRTRLWHTLLPKEAKASFPEPEKLSRLTLNGAQIRNVIRRALYRAQADNGSPRLQDLLGAAQVEMEKSDRELTEQDLRRLLEC